MTKAPPRQNRIHSIASCTQKTLLPLFAVGSGLASAPGNALELGDAVVQSRLGQPLRASIAFALAPNEKLTESCVSLSQGATPSGLPGVGRATISIAGNTLLVRGTQSIREPMVAANLVVKCPSTAGLSREYLMFIDPPGIGTDAPSLAAATPAVNAMDRPTTAARPAPVAPAAAASEPVAVAPAPPPRTARSSKPTAGNTGNQTPIGQATRYRVQPGDSLSEITARIENRSMALWPAVNRIFEANPDAFIGNDPNKLKAGSWLTIPSFDGTRAVVTPALREATDIVAIETAPADMAVPGDQVEPQQPLESVAEAAVDSVADFTADLQPVEVAEVADVTADAQPLQDAEVADNALVSTAPGETMAIPDVELQGPQTSSSSPNNTSAAIASGAPAESSSSWMLWLAGLGIAVILALLLFGRTLRDRFAPARFGDNAELPMPEKAAPRAPQAESIEVVESIDMDLADDSETVENPILDLDADLEMGTGLGDATENSQISEIGFPAPTEVDIELPLEDELSEDLAMTDTASSSASAEFDITVESEIMPENEEYDLSISEEAANLLQADDEEAPGVESIEVEAIDENLLLNDNAIDPSIAFDILEQDYEDELSATQAVRHDVVRAALDLTEVVDNLSDSTQNIAIGDDETAALQFASVTEPAAADEDQVAANDDATAQMAIDEATVEMKKLDDDKTEIMSRKRRKVDSKAG